MVSSKYRGHSIEWVPNLGPEGTWVYLEDKVPVREDPDRPCGYCDLANTPEGHDGCLGTLPGVMNACCGHGDSSEAYIQYSRDNIIRGKKALRKFKRVFGKIIEGEN